MAQSSSPSYLLLASLDGARAAAAAPSAFDAPLAAADLARSAVRKLPRLQVLGDDVETRSAGYPSPALDPLKLPIGVTGLGISGA